MSTIGRIISNKHLRYVYLPWFLLVIFYMYQYTFRIYPNLLEEPIKLAFKIHAQSFGSIGALYLLAYSLFQIPLGIIVDRFGVKRVVLISILLCISGVAAFRFTNIFIIAQVGRVFMGLGSAAAFMCALKVIADHFPPGKRGFLMGLTLTFGTMSPLLTGAFISYTAIHSDWRHILDAMMLFGCALFTLIFFLMRSEEKSEYEKQNIPHISEVLANVVKLIMDRNIVVYSMLAVGLYTPLSALADVWGVSFLKQKYQLTPFIAGQISDMLFLGLSAGSLILPWYCEKKNIINKALFVCLGFLLILFSILIYGTISVKTVVVCILLIGFFSGAEMMCFTEALNVSDHKNSGEIIGVVNTLNMIGGAFIQWLIGMLLDYKWDGTFQENGLRYYSSESYAYALTSVVVMIAICGSTYFLLKSKKRKKVKV